MRINEDHLRIIVSPSIATSAVATLGFSFWSRIRKGRFPPRNQIVTQAIFSFCGGMLATHFWLKTREREKESFNRMLRMAAGTYEVKDMSSGAGVLEYSSDRSKDMP